MTVIPNGLPTAAGLSQTASAQRVATPSGQHIEVRGDAERLFYEGQSRKYLVENRFTNASDLLDLDRLVFLELLIYRASVWLGRGQDYDGTLLGDRAEQDARRSLKENSALISTIKNDLGMTKSQRDKAQFENAGSYITQLKQRAKEFGVHREQQLDRALVMINQLFSIVGAFDRSNEFERKKIGFESEAEILDWVREVMRPEYEAVDKHFVQHTQRYWTDL